MGSSVILKSDGPISSIVLNQPDRRNVLSSDMVVDLNAALTAVTSDTSARVAIIRAEGPAFCAGMDLKKVALDDPAQAAEFAVALGEAYKKILSLPIPLLAAVDGPAMGGAVGLALAADIVWMGPQGKFAFPETRVGVVPALVSVIARRRIAPGKLMGLALAGIEVPPADALRLGFAEFVSSESATADAHAFAEKIIRENSGEAMRRTKAFLHSQFARELDREIANALTEFKQAVATDACSRGLKAFRDKAKLDWTA